MALSSVCAICEAGLPEKIARYNGHQTAHDVGVAIAPECQYRVRPHATFADDPDLAGAALHLVRRRVFGLAQRGKTAAQLDQVTVAIVPIVEKLEIFDDCFDVRISHAAFLVKPDIGRAAPGIKSIKSPS